MKTANALSAWVMLARLFFGRHARRVYLALLLLLILFSAAIRARSFLLTQKIHAVLSGLAMLKVDETTEQQLVKTVPYLVPEKTIRPGGQRYYHADISNTDDDRWMGWVPEFLYKLDPPRIGDAGVENKWKALSLPLKVAYVLGWRHLSFRADVVILNGNVSGTWYGIEPDVFLGAPTSYLVVARSVHGFWKRDRGVPVQSTDDESPDYRFGFVAGQFSFFTGADSAIGVAYTPEARPDLISHVYSVDLRCFWSIRGCDSIRQVTPFLWEDREAIVTTTEARLHSANPCPDEVLRGRIRTLLDLDIALLEVVKSRSEEDNNEGDRTGVISTDFQLKEVIRGHPQGPWTNMRHRQTIQWPFARGGQIANPMGPGYLKPGDQVLYFSGARFDSCRIVPATPSAQSIVRSVFPPSKRTEDDIGGFWGRS